MEIRGAPPFQHAPYDGSSQPFTVGLRPVAEEAWLEPDPFLTAHLAEKERLIDEVPETVFRAEADTGPAQEEVLALVAGALAAHHRDTHAVSDDCVRLLGSGREVDLRAMPALLTASRLVQEDLVLMRAGPEGYRLAAASLCFPSSWSLAEKFGGSMTAIHDNVPGFNGSRMGTMVARIFENLQTSQVLSRFNWSLYPDAELHHPRPKAIRPDIGEDTLARLFVRVERQTLRRLAGSGDILFTIKIHHDPLAALAQQPDRAVLAEGLRRQLLALDGDQIAYKGLGPVRDRLAEELQRLMQTS